MNDSFLRPTLLLVVCASLLACAAEAPGDTPPEPVLRRVLHEAFTGSNCGPCLEAEENLEGVLDANPSRHTVLKYQVGSDPYMSREAVNRRMGYLPGDSSYAIPFVHADGVNGFHPNDARGDGEPYDQALFDEFAEPLAWMNLAVAFELTGQTVDLQVRIEALADFESEDLVLHAAIVEGLTLNNVGINGQTEFHDVMKKMVPDDDGTGLDAMVAGDVREVELSWTFQGEYNPDTAHDNMVDHSVEHTVEEFEDLYAVVWVQDATGWQVHQSADSED
jgi:hypothetical protein